MCYFCLVALTVCDGGLHIPARPSSLQQATNIDVQKELSVAGPAALQGGLSLAQLKVRAGKTIALPSGASAFVTVADDGADEANELTVAAPADGQLLLLSNSDAQPTAGLARVPPGALVLLVYDGGAALWRDVHALHAPIEVRLRSCATLPHLAPPYHTTAPHLTASYYITTHHTTPHPSLHHSTPPQPNPP